ncbi:MAG: ABC transporter ATP-binding protein [Rhizobiaceae bacterium]|nr:ABC transporter ATP-binding protein [Rhizobiaceae bacterium]
MTFHRSSIRLAGLRKQFGPHKALDGIDVTVAPGSFTAVLGPSGSGKSTLLMSIAGFQELDAGSVYVDDVDITAVAPQKRGIGIVFQGYALFPHMTVADNIAYPLRARGLPRAEIATRVDAMAKIMEIEPLLARLPAQVSGGQRQRVAIARALVFEPPLLLLDEPLSALDRHLRDRMKEELRLVHRRTGVTIIMVTHDQEEAMELADRMIVMEHGAVIADGAPAALYRRPANRKIAAFLGQANFLAAREAAHGAVSAGGTTVDASVLSGTGGTLLIRQEALVPVAAPRDHSCLTIGVDSLLFRAGRYVITGQVPTGETVTAEFSGPASEVEGRQTMYLEIREATLLD